MAPHDSDKATTCVCGNVFLPDAIFCRRCGAKRPLAATANHEKCVCGNVFVADALFCRRCGTKRPQRPEPEEKPKVAEPSEAAAPEAKAPEAKAPFVEEAGDSYYKVINGVEYDKKLLEKALHLEKDGRISFEDAEELWKEAADGKNITDIEKRTLLYCLANLQFTPKGKFFLEQQLGTEGTEPVQEAGDSYYKVINGVRYDRKLLEKAVHFEKDGHICAEDAEELWKEAVDGKTITDIERQTLVYCLANLQFTPKGRHFLEQQLGTEGKKNVQISWEQGGKTFLFLDMVEDELLAPFRKKARTDAACCKWCDVLLKEAERRRL